MKFFYLILMMIVSSTALAEYRVYKIKITNTQTGKTREILSNLMPREYVYYNTISAFEKMEIVDHWMCWKRSDGFKPFCTRPFASLAEGPKTGSQDPAQPAVSP